MADASLAAAHLDDGAAPARLDQAERAHEGRGALLIRHPRQLGEQLLVARLVVALGVARRVNPGPSSQCVHAQPRVVRERVGAGEPGEGQVEESDRGREWRERG